MDRILIILKKENGPRASSALTLGLNTIILKHVYWYTYMQQISGERLQDHCSSGFLITRSIFIRGLLVISLTDTKLEGAYLKPCQNKSNKTQLSLIKKETRILHRTMIFTNTL